MPIIPPGAETSYPVLSFTEATSSCTEHIQTHRKPGKQEARQTVQKSVTFSIYNTANTKENIQCEQVSKFRQWWHSGGIEKKEDEDVCGGWNNNSIRRAMLLRGARCNQGVSMSSVWEVTAITLFKGEKKSCPTKQAQEEKWYPPQQVWEERTGTSAGLMHHFPPTHLETSDCFPLADCDHFSISANIFCWEKKTSEMIEGERRFHTHTHTPWTQSAVLSD